MSEDDGMDGIEDVLPASRTQSGMLFETLQNPTKGVNLGLLCAQLPVDLDVMRFKAAWDTVVTRHQNLRSQLMWEGLSAPLQVIHDDVTLTWEEADWRGVSDLSETYESLLEAWRTAPVNLGDVPLMRLLLARHDAGYAFFWLSHHALIDDWSVAVVLDETQTLYHSDNTLPQPTPYRAFADWLAGRDEQADDAHWAARMRGLDTPTRLALGAPTAAPDHTAHVSGTVSLSPEQTTALETVARELRVTLGTVLAVVWGIAVHRLSGQIDVAFGMAATQRPSELPGIDRAVGNFVATQPVRITLPDQKLRHLIAVRGTEALMDQDRGAADLSALARDFDLGPGALPFDSILAVNENHGAQTDTSLYGDIKLQNFSSLPVAIIMRPGPTLGVTVLADPTRFDAAGRRLILDMIQSVLIAIPANLDCLAAQLPLMSAPDDIGSALDDTPLLPNAIATQFATKPNHPAIIDANGTHTYANLEAQVAKLAGQMHSAGVQPADRVAVFLDRGLAALAGFLAAWRLGATYVPLDPSQDDALIGLMIDTGQVAMVLTDSYLRPRISTTLPVVLADDPPTKDTTPTPTRGDDLAYIMFTSGSTGTPKGVMISHTNLAASTAARTQWFENAPERYLVVSPFGFDSSVAGIYWTLATGGTLIVPDAQTVRNPAELARMIARNAVTHMLCLPTLYDLILANAKAAELNSLNTVIVAGEATTMPLVKRHYDFLDPCQLVNEYGPTEATVWCAATQLRATDTDVTIGTAIPGTRLSIRDTNGLSVPNGLLGELWVAGLGVAQGYYNRSDLTDESFVDDDGQRYYKTGDLVRRLPDGRMAYLGRTDDQIKVRGQRIELAEVDAALLALPGVTAAAAVAVPHQSGLRLIAYVTGTVETRAMPQRLQPHHVVCVDELPRTSTGKTDRNALRQRGIPTTQAATHLPSTDTEAAVAGHWQDALGLSDLPDVETEFFALGGDSLMAMRLLGTIAEDLSREISVAQMLNGANTIRSMASALDAQSQSQQTPQATFPAIASTSQRALWLAAKMHPNEPFFNLAKAIHIDADVSKETVQAAMQALATRHEILTCQFALKDRQLWINPDANPAPLHHEPTTTNSVEVWLQAETEHPFSMDSSPLWRVSMRRSSTSGTDIALIVHHTICDGWSLDLLASDFAQLLAAQPLGGRPRQGYADFLAAPASTENQPFWQDLLSGAKPMPQISGIAERPTKARAKGIYRSQSLDVDATAHLVALAKHRACSIFVPLWVATARFLATETGQPDTLIAVSHANRPSADFLETVGCFTQALPYRLDTHANDLIDLAAKKMQDIALHEHVDASQLAFPKTDTPRGYLTAFSPVALQFNDFGNAQFDNAPGVTPIKFTPHLTSYFELSIEWRMIAGRLHCGILARDDLFTPNALEDIVQRYCDVAAHVGR